MKKKDEPLSELVQAASALDRELAHFAELSHQLQKEPLGTQKSLDRAVSFMKQVTDTEATLRASMTKLGEAIGAAQQRQQQEVEKVNARAAELEARLATFRELHARYEGLGQVALQVNQALLALGGKKLAEKENAAEVAKVLPELIESLVRASGVAKELVVSAEEKGFPDLSRSAETLRQQILAAQNKLNLLQKKLGEA